MTEPKMDRGCPLCWHCLNRLKNARGGGFAFSLVEDRGGTQHRVHHSCLPLVTEDGHAKEVKR